MARLYGMMAKECLKNRILAPLAPLWMEMAAAERTQAINELATAERIDEEVKKMRRNQYWRNSVLTGLLVTLAVMALVVIGPVWGQDGEATAVVTPDAEVTVIPAPGDDAPDVVVIEQPGDSSGFNLWTFLGGALTGALTALGAVFGIVGRLKNDVAALNAIEWLGKSVPADTLNTINDMAQKMKDAADVMIRVTDGLPNEPGEAQRVYSQRVIPPAPPSAGEAEG